MNIDLRTCKPGQKLKMRNGNTASYTGMYTGMYTYPHLVNHAGESWSRCYQSNGRWYSDDETYPFDIVEILPLEEAVVKLNVFVKSINAGAVYELQKHGDKYAWYNVVNSLKLYDGATCDSISSAIYFVLKNKFVFVEPLVKHVKTVEYVQI